MKKFKVGDLVMSTVTKGHLRQGEVYKVSRKLLPGYEVTKDGQKIYMSVQIMEHATKLHKLLAGDDNV